MSRTELSKNYEPTEVERRWYAHWQERGYFAPRDGAQDQTPFVPKRPLASLDPLRRARRLRQARPVRSDARCCASART